MSKIVKFFTNKKSSHNKENDTAMKRVNLERASVRSEAGAAVQQRERDRLAMRAIANPYSVWTEPKKTKAPSSCPGVALDSSYFNERRSVRPPKQQRAGSVYGDVNELRQYRIDGPDIHNHNQHQFQQHGQRQSKRYGDLSAIEERSDKGELGPPHEWIRSSQRRPSALSHAYMDYTSGDSEEEDEYVRRLEHKMAKLKDDKARYRSQLEHTRNELEYTKYQLRDTSDQLKLALERCGKMERELTYEHRQKEKLQTQLQLERKETELLSQRLSEMSTSTSTANGAIERLVSSSETSLEMEGEEIEAEEEDDDEDNGESAGGDEVRCFRASAESAEITVNAPTSEVAEEVEQQPCKQLSRPQFELRRSYSDMGPVSTTADGAGEEMAEGGSWRRRDKRRSFVKRSFLPPPQESESSDGERVLFLERQVRKRGSLIKYDPSRRVPVKDKHYRRFGKPERQALDDFTFLEQEVTDISGMLSSPSDGIY